MATLVEHYKVKDVTAGWTRIQQKTLEKIPEALLLAAVDRCISTRTFFPKPPELLADAEAVRRELIARLPWEPCEVCSRSGWVEWLVDGVKRVKRCECFTSYRRRLEALGAGNQPLALPAAVNVSEP